MGKSEVALLRELLQALTVPVPDIMASKMAGALNIDMNSVPKRVFPQYICNASGQNVNAVFGVHPHGYWRGGTVTYNPNTKRFAKQFLVSQGIRVTFDASGNATAYTVTAGRTLYITSLWFVSSNTGPKYGNITDGSGGATRGRVGYETAGNITQMSFPAPLGPFITSVYIDGDFSNTATGDVMLTGYEEVEEPNP